MKKKFFFLFVFSFFFYPITSFALSPDICGSGFGDVNYNDTFHDIGADLFGQPTYANTALTRYLNHGNDSFYRGDNQTPEDASVHYYISGDSPIGAYTNNAYVAPAGSFVTCPTYSYEYEYEYQYPYPTPSIDGSPFGSYTDLSTSTTDRLLGSLNFGIAIIIVFFCLGFVGYVYNKITSKKSWL